MRLVNWRIKVLLFAIFSCVAACAHIGDQNVFFEGNAGPYPVRIIIRPPGVIPGLAEISVRVHTNGVERVTALPMRWDSGRKGAPPADEGKRVRGETNLFNAQLWFMRGGAQSVEVAVNGAAGVGTVIVPVNAVATRVLGMPRALGWTLFSLGVLLVSLAVSIMGAAVRESVLPAGGIPTRKRQWFARSTVVLSLVGMGALLWFGKKWWDAEASDYRNNRLYRPLESSATLRNEDGHRVLTLERAVNPRRNNGPIVPEHGKLMHLFLVREPQMDVFAHLHPMKRDWKTFETVLPGLPGGDYRVYADVTYETGFSDTLTSAVRLPEVSGGSTVETRSDDPDDSWKASHPFEGGTNTNKQRTALSSSLWMDMTLSSPLVENRENRLHFAVLNVILRPVKLDHFMGMGGHLILRREDGAVFTHLHPSGSFSMAAQQLFQLRADGKAPLKIASSKSDPICKLPEFDPTMRGMPPHEDISFTYAFPKAGAYRLWVQVKVSGEILTGVFDVNVAAAQPTRYASAEAR